MYYEEKIIDGRTYFRTSPTGDWSSLVSNEDLTKQIEELKSTIKQMLSLDVAVEV